MNADCYNCYNCIILVPIYSNIRKWEILYLGSLMCTLDMLKQQQNWFFYLMIWDEWQDEKKYCRFLNVQQTWICIDFTCLYYHFLWSPDCSGVRVKNKWTENYELVILSYPPQFEVIHAYNVTLQPRMFCDGWIILNTCITCTYLIYPSTLRNRKNFC